MILVCNGIRNDLQHPNEYIRGMTLRFLAKLREAELIEPLLTPARSCLEHRHAYVRKNATFAIANIYLHTPELIPDAADLLATFLESESDPTCKRNAFAALSSIDHDKALAYLSSVFDGVPNAEELLQLVELEFIRKDAIKNSQNKVGDTVEEDLDLANRSAGQIPEINIRPPGSEYAHCCLRSCFFIDSFDEQSRSSEGCCWQIHRASNKGGG
jgi:vesicle coat complex subunit